MLERAELLRVALVCGSEPVAASTGLTARWVSPVLYSIGVTRTDVTDSLTIDTKPLSDTHSHQSETVRLGSSTRRAQTAQTDETADEKENSDYSSPVTNGNETEWSATTIDLAGQGVSLNLGSTYYFRVRAIDQGLAGTYGTLTIETDVP